MAELEWSEDDMDKAVYLICNDNDFISKCIRKRITHNLFSSNVRQEIVRAAYSYFERYQVAPKDDTLDIVADLVKSEEDQVLYANYLSKVYKVGKLGISPDFLLDRMDFFIKKRVVINTTNKLLKLQDTFSTNPDRPLDIMREAIRDVEISMGERKAESILEDYSADFLPDTATCFGVSELDSPMGGGLKFGDYVILLGYTGVGKSWCISHLAKMAVRLGVTPLYMPIEMNNKTARIRLRQSFSGLTKAEVLAQSLLVDKVMRKAMVNRSDVILLSEEEKMMKVTSLPFILDDVEDRYGIRPRLILIDSADDLAPPDGRYNTPLDASTEKHTWLKNYAKSEDICIVSTVQAKAEAKNKFWIGSDMVGENFYKIKRATKGISINGIDGEKSLGYRRIYLFKHTDGPEEIKIWIKENLNIGQFILDGGRYYKAEYDVIWDEAKKITRGKVAPPQIRH